MMWFPAVVLAVATVVLDRLRRERDFRTCRRDRAVGLGLVAVLALATGIVVQEAALQTLAWLS